MTRISTKHPWNKRNTRVEITPNGGQVILHNTTIVRWDCETVRLNSGGWQSVTTKRRMNQISDHFQLGFSVFQKRGVWYVNPITPAPEPSATDQDKIDRFYNVPQSLEIDFHDGMIMSRN